MRTSGLGSSAGSSSAAAGSAAGASSPVASPPIASSRRATSTALRPLVSRPLASSSFLRAATVISAGDFPMVTIALFDRSVRSSAAVLWEGRRILRSEGNPPAGSRAQVSWAWDAFFELSSGNPIKCKLARFRRRLAVPPLGTPIKLTRRRITPGYYLLLSTPIASRVCDVTSSVPSTRAHPRWAAASPTFPPDASPRGSKDLRAPAPVGRVNPPPWPARISPGTVAPTPGRRGSTAPPASRTPSPRKRSPPPSPRAHVRAHGG